MQNLKSVKLFGINITSDSKQNILKYILDSLERRQGEPSCRQAGLKIFTPNPEIIMYARSHSEFKKILNEAEVNLPDGVGLLLASRLLGLSLKSRIPGTDFMEDLCKAISEYNLSALEHAKKPLSMGFFGGRGNVARVTSECLQKKYSGLKILYADENWDEAKMQGKHIDLLFVAMGCPLQEKWISENLPAGRQASITAAMGVGGAFDFYAGKVPRAPHFLRTIGLEWLFRLMIQPWRIKRQLQLIIFLGVVGKEFFRTKILGQSSN